MSALRTFRLDECCEIVSGSTPKTGESANWDGDICWATPKDLSDLDGMLICDTARKITQRGLDSCGASILPARSVLFSSRAPIGHLAINTRPMATNQGFKSLVPKADLVHPEYLYYWLRANREYLNSLGNGATFKEVSKATISRVTVPLPPLPEQRRIATILDKADALRAKRRAALAELDGLAQAIFLEMFGDPTSNTMKWPMSLLSEACTKISDGTHHSPPIQKDGVPYVTAKHLKESGLAFHDDPWFISPSDHAAIYSRCDPKSGDVLYIKDGATTGIAAVNRYGFEFSMLSSLALLRPDTHQLHAEYLCKCLNNPAMKTRILGAMAGAAIRRLTLAKIKAIAMPLPPLKLQMQFAERVTAIEAIVTAHRTELSELDRLFATLQHRAFRGEL